MNETKLEFFILCCLQCLHLLLKLYFALFQDRMIGAEELIPRKPKEGSHLKQRPNYSLDFQAELSASGQAPTGPRLPIPTSSPAAVDSARLGLEGGGQRALVIFKRDVVAQEVGAGEKLNLAAEMERDQRGG